MPTPSSDNSRQPLPPTNPEILSQAATLSALLENAIMEFSYPAGENPTRSTTEALKLLDQAFTEVKSSQVGQDFLSKTALRLFADSTVFENLNFHASLISDGSEVFSAVIRKMGDIVASDSGREVEDAMLPVMIRLVEAYRRSNETEMLQSYAERVSILLQPRLAENEALAQQQIAKVLYEQAMHAYNLGQFKDAIAIAKDSELFSHKAGDEYGELAARGVAYGLFGHSFARTLESQDDQRNTLITEGRSQLEKDLLRTRELLSNPELDSLLKSQFQRVEYNNAAHLMNIAELTSDAKLAANMIAILEKNPIYLSADSLSEPYQKIMRQLEQ